MPQITKTHMRRAAMAGLGAVSGFKTAQGPAMLAARVPLIGPLLGIMILGAGAAAGIATAAGSDD